MKDEENIAGYLLHVDEIVNTIKALGEKVEDLMIVPKVVRSLPLRFENVLIMSCINNSKKNPVY